MSRTKRSKRQRHRRPLLSDPFFRFLGRGLEQLEDRRMLATVVDDVRTVRAGEQANPVADQFLIEDVNQLIVTFSADMSVAGGASGPNSVLNHLQTPFNWRIAKIVPWKPEGLWNPDGISSVSYGLDGESEQYEALITFTNTLDNGAYKLTAMDTMHDAAGNPLDGNSDGVAGGHWSTTFTVLPTEPHINTHTSLAQSAPAVAMGADGRYVVTWHSENQDGSNYGIYAQRYAAVPSAS